MSSPSPSPDLSKQPLRLGPESQGWIRFCIIAAVVGVLSAVAHLFLAVDGDKRFFLAYVVAYGFILSLSLGGLFFVMIQHLSRAGWSVVVRRPAELLAANMPVVALLFLPIAVSVAMGGGEIYPWAQPDSAAVEYAEEGTFRESLAGVEHLYLHQVLDGLTMEKRPYLNRPFFLLRWALFLALWMWMAHWFLKHSTLQDETGDHQLTVKQETWAGLLLLIYALTVSFGAWDLLMSVNPHWFSTIFGVYYFTGAVAGTLAVMILLLKFLQGRGYLNEVVTVEHYHDLGKFLFAFVFFWGYIAFSQYMLIWYAALPETTGWFTNRGATAVREEMNGWLWIAILLVVGHFVIPFVGLMSRHVKRNGGGLVFWAGWVLVFHWLDIYWVVMPEMGPAVVLGPMEIGLAVALSAVFAIGLIRRASKVNLVPTHDPRLADSIAFENL
ncbi:MAG: hypothetical protein JJU36_06150 [Phycisphaeraceae bacterium]|nr:hypothetical protein [Phycisphaeraceae bacterium]